MCGKLIMNWKKEKDFVNYSHKTLCLVRSKISSLNQCGVPVWILEQKKGHQWEKTGEIQKVFLNWQ